MSKQKPLSLCRRVMAVHGVQITQFRAPAWCDRVLFRSGHSRVDGSVAVGSSEGAGADDSRKGINTGLVTQFGYRRSETPVCSDHKPVSASFRFGSRQVRSNQLVEGSKQVRGSGAAAVLAATQQSYGGSISCHISCHPTMMPPVSLGKRQLQLPTETTLIAVRASCGVPSRCPKDENLLISTIERHRAERLLAKTNEGQRDRQTHILH